MAKCGGNCGTQSSAKLSQWLEMLDEVHSMKVSDPEVAGNFISCKMTNDITFKGQGKIAGSETAVFKAKDCRIVREQFSYSM